MCVCDQKEWKESSTTYHQQNTLEIIALLVSQEIADDEDAQDEQGDHEDFKVEVHLLAQSPADKHHQRSVEEGRLDRRAETVVQRKVHLAVPCLVDGREVLGGLFHQGQQDQPQELVGDTGVDDEFDLLDQEEGEEGDEE